MANLKPLKAVFVVGIRILKPTDELDEDGNTEYVTAFDVVREDWSTVNIIGRMVDCIDFYRMGLSWLDRLIANTREPYQEYGKLDSMFHPTLTHLARSAAFALKNFRAKTQTDEASE